MGIDYGVIPQNDVLQAWADSSEGDYGPACCPKCGNEAVGIDHEDVPDFEDMGDGWEAVGWEFACLDCKYTFDADEAYGDEPNGWNLDDGEYQATQGGDDCDIFVLKSPYYTFGPFCSPCAPGAVYLRDGSEEGEKAYCFAPDWFWGDSDEVCGEYEGEVTSCPYPVYRVADDVCVYVPNKA